MRIHFVVLTLTHAPTIVAYWRCYRPFTITEQEQQCVAVGPRNAHFISIRQVSSNAAILRRDTFGRWTAAAAADAATAVYRQCDNINYY